MLDNLHPYTDNKEVGGGPPQSTASKPMPAAIDITGQRFGKLTVTSFAETRGGKRYWNATCSCGAKSAYATGNLRSGISTSCGCKKQITRKANALKKHIAQYVGNVFGDLTVIDIKRTIKKDGKSSYEAIAECSCGNIIQKPVYDLAKGSIVSCGCKRGERIAAAKFKDITGQHFGNLTALTPTFRVTATGKKRAWNCLCICGNTKEVNLHSLLSGATTSCGCVRRGDDSIGGWLNGTFRSPEADAFFYIFEMANYAELSKPGIAVSMTQRADAEYGNLHDFIALPRLDAWLIEQAILSETCSHHDCPVELVNWDGHSELRKLKPQILFGYAVGFYKELQSLGREEFAIQYVPTTPKQREQLRAMKGELEAA